MNSIDQIVDILIWTLFCGGILISISCSMIHGGLVATNPPDPELPLILAVLKVGTVMGMILVLATLPALLEYTSCHI